MEKVASGPSSVFSSLVAKYEINFANVIIEADMKPQINAYLEDLAESDVRSLAEVISFNEKHADLELPPRKLPMFYTSRIAELNF